MRILCVWRKTDFRDGLVLSLLFPRVLLVSAIKTTLGADIRPTIIYLCLFCGARAIQRWNFVKFFFTFSVTNLFLFHSFSLLLILCRSSAGDMRQVGKTNGHRCRRPVPNYRKTSKRLSYFIWGGKKSCQI